MRALVGLVVIIGLSAGYCASITHTATWRSQISTPPGLCSQIEDFRDYDGCVQKWAIANNVTTTTSTPSDLDIALYKSGQYLIGIAVAIVILGIIAWPTLHFLVKTVIQAVAHAFARRAIG